MKYGFIAKHRTIWPTRTMCRLLGVSTSGFYDWLDRPVSQHQRENAQLLQAIKHSHEASDGTYGSPRVVRDLIDAGFACSENRVARLMKAAGIKARHKRRRTPEQRAVAAHSVAPNLLDRQFAATEPNQKWAADFTYVWTGEGWLFVAVVLDLYSRRVVGWSMQSTMTAQLVMDALLMAVFRRGRPRAVLHHSDQGSQYTSEDFQRLLESHGIICSMSRRGNCWDNAAMESFFSTLKTERLSKKHYRTRDDLRADVFDYIERFYNPHRRHSTLGYLSPVQFENLKRA
ncbi:putative transposase [Herbaspirillum seropedicae]|nr:putative transposase [Herbaspirillum seropedicae]